MRTSHLYLKLLPLFIAGIMVTGAYNNCKAQSIVGKWERVSAKMIAIEKATGKRQDASAQMQQMVKTMKQVMEFKANKTWIMTTYYGKKPMGEPFTGTYTFSGNKLKTELDPALAAKFKKAAAELKKNPKYKASTDVEKGLPDAINVKSLTGAVMVWSYDGNLFGGDEEMAKKYTVEQEVTYKKI